MRLKIYLWGVVICTLVGFIYGLLRRRYFRNKPSLGWPIKNVNVPWFELMFYTAVSALAGAIWPFW